MKVTGLQTILLDNIPPYRGGRQWLFIKLMTDEGLVGLGERVTGHARSLTSQIALLTELCEEFVIGENPFQVERIWQRMFAARHDYRHPSMDSTPAISAPVAKPVRTAGAKPKSNASSDESWEEF